jgi:SnoaL-like domain
MSRENVDLFKESMERFNSADVAGALRYMHPEIRFEHRLAELRGDLTGIEAVRDWFVDATKHFDRWRIDCDDVRDLGDRCWRSERSEPSGRRAGLRWRCPTRSWPRLGTAS